MTDKTFLDLDTTDSLNSSDRLYISQGGDDKTIPASALLEDISNGTPFKLDIKEETTTDRVLTSSDDTSYISFINSSPSTVVVPPQSQINWKRGAIVYIKNSGNGVSINSGVGVTVNASASGLSLTEPNQIGALVRVKEDEWDFVTGGVSLTQFQGAPKSLTVAALVQGIATDGSLLDLTTLASTGTPVETTMHNTTSKEGGAKYIVKTLAQAAVDGDTIDGSGSPNYFGGNHAVSDGIHCLIISLSGIVNVKQFGAVGNALESDFSGSDDTIALNSAALYCNRVSGRMYLPKSNYLITGEVSITASTSIVVYGDGPSSTKVFAKTADGASIGTLFNAFRVRGNGTYNFSDMMVKGERDRVSITDLTQNAGVAAFNLEALGQGTATNLRAEEWIGSGFRGGFNQTFLSCRAVHCGVPNSSPYVEYGDGFYASGASKISFIDCHYEGALSGTSRTSRGGFVFNSSSANFEGSALSIINCSSVNADRGIHLEDCPSTCSVDNFKVVNARNALICWRTHFESIVTVNNMQVNNCGFDTSGVFFTGETEELFLDVSNVRCIDMIGTAFYRHHQGTSPKRMTWRNVDVLNSTPKEFFIIRNGTTSEITGQVKFDQCDFEYGNLLVTRFQNIVAENTKISKILGQVSGPDRTYIFNSCRFVGGVPDSTRFTGANNADMFMRDCIFEYDSSDGNHFLFEGITSCNIYITNPKVIITNADPIVFNKTGASGNLIVTQIPFVTDVTQAKFWVASDVSMGGSVNVTNTVFGDVHPRTPTGLESWQSGRLRINDSYLWVDNSGRLRISQTAPGSDSSGVVVGTQT